MSALCLLLLRTPLTMKVENGIKLLKLRRLIVIYPVHAARSSAQCVYSVCLHGLAPRYLSDHIQPVADSNRRRLRSSSSMQLAIRRTRLSTVGDVRFQLPDAAFGTVCHPMSRQLQRSLFFGIASRHTSSQDHFLHYPLTVFLFLFPTPWTVVV